MQIFCFLRLPIVGRKKPSGRHASHSDSHETKQLSSAAAATSHHLATQHPCILSCEGLASLACIPSPLNGPFTSKPYCQCVARVTDIRAPLQADLDMQQDVRMLTR